MIKRGPSKGFHFNDDRYSKICDLSVAKASGGFSSLEPEIIEIAPNRPPQNHAGALGSVPPSK